MLMLFAVFVHKEMAIDEGGGPNGGVGGGNSFHTQSNAGDTL